MARLRSQSSGRLEFITDSGSNFLSTYAVGMSAGVRNVDVNGLVTPLVGRQRGLVVDDTPSSRRSLRLESEFRESVRARDRARAGSCTHARLSPRRQSTHHSGRLARARAKRVGSPMTIGAVTLERDADFGVGRVADELEVHVAVLRPFRRGLRTTALNSFDPSRNATAIVDPFGQNVIRCPSSRRNPSGFDCIKLRMAATSLRLSACPRLRDWAPSRDESLRPVLPGRRVEQSSAAAVDRGLRTRCAADR